MESQSIAALPLGNGALHCTAAQTTVALGVASGLSPIESGELESACHRRAAESLHKSSLPSLALKPHHSAYVAEPGLRRGIGPRTELEAA